MSAADIDLARAELAQLLAGLTRLQAALERLKAGAVQDRLPDLPPSTAPPARHRRRPGRLSKIAADPELQAFILPLLDRLTYHQIAEEVGTHFPPERRVRHSGVHRWASRGRQSGRSW